MKHIPVGNGKHVIVNDEDYEWLNQWRWHSCKGYARRQEGKTFIIMHRLIMQTPSHLQVDHINGNRLDNRRQNLRNCTLAENRKNKSKTRQGYKGVEHHTENCYGSYIRSDNKCFYLGSFPKDRWAAMCYDI